MARTINEIFTDKLAKVAADVTLGPLLTSTSRVSIYRLLLYISAVCDWTLETLFDLHKQEIDDTIATKKPHSLQWYAQKAKDFQYGYDLVPESDVYDNTGLSDDDIDNSKVVSYAAVVEQVVDSRIRLRVKVATTTGADLGPLTAPQLASLIAYFNRVKDAGVLLNITSTAADDLKLSVRIKYNPLVLKGTGERIDGVSATPVQDAIKKHLQNLPFNGVFSVQKLVDAIQLVEGVDDVAIDLVQTRYGVLPFASVDITYTPDAGYLRIDDADLTTQFIAS
jgi:hypothetical protein